VRAAAIACSIMMLLAPLAAEARQTGKVYRIGLITTLSPDHPWIEPLRDGLRELGWIEGQNLAIEWRLTHASEGFPEMAAELVRLKVDVIVAPSNPAIRAARRATTTIPIVMVISTDAVDLGFVASLARPCGNLTGVTALGQELVGSAWSCSRKSCQE